MTSAESISSELVAAERLAPSDAADAAPLDAGIYAWWSRDPEIGNVPGTPHADWYLYYVGIADRATKKSLLARLRNHVRGSTRGSTERLTLAALLGPERGWSALLVVGNSAKGTLRARLADKRDEEALSAWMEGHLTVSWVALASPRGVEDKVLGILQPPLNLQGNTAHESYSTIKAARARFKASAQPRR